MYETQSYEDSMVLPPEIRGRWDFMETGAASAVLRSVCPIEGDDIKIVLKEFALDPKVWLHAGGNRGGVPKEIDDMFFRLGWREMRIDLRTTGILVAKDSKVVEELPPLYQEGYLVDNFKGRVALDVEWNAKDGNLDRDLSAYRAWHEAGVIAAAVIITQNRESLKRLAEELWCDYQETIPEGLRSNKLPIDLNTSTTTNLEKTKIRVRRGVMGTCPLLVVAANRDTWNGMPYRGTV